MYFVVCYCAGLSFIKIIYNVHRRQDHAKLIKIATNWIGVILLALNAYAIVCTAIKG